MALWALCDLRTFPDKHKGEMSIDSSILLNNLGKIFEDLNYVVNEWWRVNYYDPTISVKIYQRIVKVRTDLEDKLIELEASKKALQ